MRYPMGGAKCVLAALVVLAVLMGCSVALPPAPTSTPVVPTLSPPASTAAAVTTGAAPEATAHPTPATGVTPADPFDLISQDSLFAYLEDLTAIQAYSGWRNSATQGEAEGLDYVTAELGRLDYLQGLGLELERQSFHVFLATEIWESRLWLTVGGQEVEVPADGMRGQRDDVAQALNFDSDGAPNDADPDPVSVEGPALLLRTASELRAAKAADVEGRLVFLDYAVVDRVLVAPDEVMVLVFSLLAKRPAGLVLVSSFSNAADVSHGAFLGEGSALNGMDARMMRPTLYVRLEDLAPAGVRTWDDLAGVEAARLTWDADVFAPGTSGNLVARIPGRDPSTAVILGAHVDSPNSPGAMDDGSGSVVLLEVARVLDAAHVQPESDLVLVWFGSEELGLYGSAHFANTHQELLDRTLAMLQIDCLTRPVDGIDPYLTLVTWSYGRLGDARLAWPDYLAGRAAQRGVEAVPAGHFSAQSDNTPFSAFDVPNANLIYADQAAMEQLGSLHYAGHIHDPYDTPELAREVGGVLEQMARVALVAALETGAGPEHPTLRVAPVPDRRAVFVASHTEPVHMGPTALTDMGMALAWEGFDVDLVPYGQPVTAADLENADLVVVLPVADYPVRFQEDAYDEAWSEAEIDVLEGYAAGGGLLVLTGSAHRLKYANWAMDFNEDVSDVNALSTRFGIAYTGVPLYDASARVVNDHPLVEGLRELMLAEGNAVPLQSEGGQVLAQAGRAPVVVLVDHGRAGGQVLALADVGILGAGWDGPANLPFWRNLAQYARNR